VIMFLKKIFSGFTKEKIRICLFMFFGYIAISFFGVYFLFFPIEFSNILHSYMIVFFVMAQIVFYVFVLYNIGLKIVKWISSKLYDGVS